MSAERTPDPAPRSQERRLLLAVDESDSSRRAVMYVADFFGDYKEIVITLFSILPEPSEDYFHSDEERRQWLNEQRRSREAMLGGYRKILAGAGIREDRIETRLATRQCLSIGDAILEAQEELRCCIVVLGRRGLSHEEEFIFGSTTSRIIHHARHCAVMVVE
jgi:nucleotide-binding universal stress UspA family protein